MFIAGQYGTQHGLLATNFMCGTSSKRGPYLGLAAIALILYNHSNLPIMTSLNRFAHARVCVKMPQYAEFIRGGVLLDAPEVDYAGYEFHLTFLSKFQPTVFLKLDSFSLF